MGCPALGGKGRSPPSALEGKPVAILHTNVVLRVFVDGTIPLLKLQL